MAGAHKTLKVTCGSFSCTLEGFEDPVATLVAVTRHFQSLAAPESLFAAQGPVPDANIMLRLTGTDPALPDPPGTEKGPPAARQGRLANGTPPAPDPDADVNRLLSLAMVEMQGADQRRRLATIGHLKAAVAATEGDPGAGQDDPTRQDRYRADLARVVRSFRPPQPGPQPVPDEPTPLLLGPEQRVSVPDAADAVATADATAQADPAAAMPATFADLAAVTGAVTFADLMEAAAAFLICTRGEDSFTRPDLMRQLSTLPGPRGGSPEDQMRGFGILLRDGRILRAGRGSFDLPPDALVLARARRLIA